MFGLSKQRAVRAKEFSAAVGRDHRRDRDLSELYRLVLLRDLPNIRDFGRDGADRRAAVRLRG